MADLAEVAAGDLTVVELCGVLAGKLDEWGEVSTGDEDDLDANVDLERALVALEDVQMRATRGIARKLGRFAPTDLERQDGVAMLVASQGGARVIQASTPDAAAEAVSAGVFGAGAELVGPLDGS